MARVSTPQSSYGDQSRPSRMIGVMRDITAQHNVRDLPERNV
jgi:hypothetical protein